MAVALFAPGLQAQAADVICSASGGIQALPASDGDAPPLHGHRHDCGLCAVFGLPPEPLAFTPPEFAPRQVPAPRPVFVAAHSAAPFGARGPPLA